jgi:hypothetical protein
MNLRLAFFLPDIFIYVARYTKAVASYTEY